MKSIRSLFLAAMMAALAVHSGAQTTVASNTSPATNSPAATPAPAQPAITAADIQALKDALAAQQLQIQALQEQLQRRNQGSQLALPSTSDSPKSDAAQPANLSQPLAALSTPASTGAPAPVNGLVQQEPAVTPQQDQDVFNKDMEGPLTLRFRGIHITPGGFVAAEFVRRSRALGTDVSTPYNSLTMPGAPQSSLPEFFATARQSRPTVFIAAREGSVNFSGYVSTDFLSSGTTSTATQTNSYTLRIRQAWGQAKFTNGWSILGGQMWSLVTENKFELGPSDDAGRSNDSRPATIDSQYSVGFSYARQAAFRVTKSFNDKVAIAFAVENPQATVTTHGNTNDYVLLQAGASSNLNSLSTYGFNPSPDLIAKIAFDPGFGHYEIFGLYDRFTDRIYPCEDVFPTTGTPTATLPNCPSLAQAGTTAGAYNSSKSGGGFGANARWAFANKHIIFGLHGFGGSGIGRYGAAQLSDVTVNADGTLRLIRDFQGLATLEYRGKKLDVYSYVGTEYAGRTFSFDPVQNTIVGYGSPTFKNTGCYTPTAPAPGTLTGSTPLPGTLASCTSDTRDVTEGTLGFWYRFHNGPRGKFQWGAQYSYVDRSTWRGGALEPHGLDNMVFTSFRYYLP